MNNNNEKERKPYVAPEILDEIEMETKCGSVPHPPKEDTIFDF